jgi:phage terminase Nu1 subunit (DNA packaging protein)
MSTTAETFADAPFVGERECYLSRKQMAELMKISTDTLDRWVKAGMPSETWGTRRRYFLPSAALRWAREQGSVQ